jgi:hypothetical protein
MDSEGAEGRLFSEEGSAAAWLRRTRYLAMEIHGMKLRGIIEEELRRCGFRVFLVGSTTYGENLHFV